MGGKSLRGNVKCRGSCQTNRQRTLAGMAQWIECQPVNQKVSGSIPRQGTCLGGRQDPQQVAQEKHHTSMFLSPSPSLKVKK